LYFVSDIPALLVQGQCLVGWHARRDIRRYEFFGQDVTEVCVHCHQQRHRVRFLHPKCDALVISSEGVWRDA